MLRQASTALRRAVASAEERGIAGGLPALCRSAQLDAVLDAPEAEGAGGEAEGGEAGAPACLLDSETRRALRTLFAPADDAGARDVRDGGAAARA